MSLLTHRLHTRKFSTPPSALHQPLAAMPRRREGSDIRAGQGPLPTSHTPQQQLCEPRRLIRRVIVQVDPG